MKGGAAPGLSPPSHCTGSVAPRQVCVCVVGGEGGESEGMYTFNNLSHIFLLVILV